MTLKRKVVDVASTKAPRQRPPRSLVVNHPAALSMCRKDANRAIRLNQHSLWPLLEGIKGAVYPVRRAVSLSLPRRLKQNQAW